SDAKLRSKPWLTGTEAKPDPTDAIAPSPERQTAESSESKRASLGAGTGAVEEPVAGPAAVRPSAEIVSGKGAVKPKPSTGQTMPKPVVFPAHQLRSPGPPTAPISEEEIVRDLTRITETESELAEETAPRLEAPPPPAPAVPAMFVVMMT